LITKKKKKTVILNLIPFLVGLGIVGLDQLLKHIFIIKLSDGNYIDCGICDMRLVYNTGTAFGLFAGNNSFFVYISFIAIILIFILIFKTSIRNILIRSAYSMILAGAISNLIDRLRVGYVIDFIDFRFWPVFNLADTSITCGIILLFIVIFSHNQKNGGDNECIL
jgi:signal peptidase II